MATPRTRRTSVRARTAVPPAPAETRPAPPSPTAPAISLGAVPASPSGADAGGMRKGDVPVTAPGRPLVVVPAAPPARLPGDLSGMGGYVPYPYDPPAVTDADIRAQGRQERGASGTINLYGYISGEEYNPKLAGLAAMPIYAEMRNDAQVQASLLICKQPLLSADWAVHPPDGGDNQDAGIAAFCQDALLGEGGTRDTWSFVLSHLLLRLDYGFSACEIVWRIAEDRTTRIDRLAPRLPKTVERFEVDSNGDLVAIVQLAYKDLAFNYWRIPAQYCVLTVHQREGDNFYGRAILRSAYQNWFYKTHAYKVDAVRLDRYGVGIPQAEIDDSGVAVTVDELTAVDKTLKGLRSYEKSYIRTTPRVKYSILTPGGSGTGGADAMKSIEHHNEQIMANILATFLSKGGAEGGVGSNRTKALAGVFFSALESTAVEIAHDLDTQVLKRLCDLNFNMQGRRYPTLTVSNITDLDMADLAECLNKLGLKNFITPDDSIEDVLRKGLRLPPMEPGARGKDRTPAPPPAPIVMPGTGMPPTPPSSGAPSGGTKTPAVADTGAVDSGPSDQPGQDGKAAASQAHAPIRLRQNYVDPESGLVFGRAPTARESAIFALREVPRALDGFTTRLTDAIAAVRQEQLVKLASTIAQKDARPTADFTDIRPDVFTIPLKGHVEAVIKVTQKQVAEYGAEQVRNELRRQGATIGLQAPRSEDAWTLAFDLVRLAKKRTTGIIPPGADATAAAGKQKAKSQLVSSAKVTAEKLDDSWFNRILETAVRLRRGGTQGDLLKDLIISTLAQEVAKTITRDVKGEVNEAFAVGRAVEAAVHAEDISICVFSALLDTNTCSACESVDGTETEFGSDVYQELMPPYSECEGNLGTPDSCRCTWIFILADRQEGKQ